MASRKISKGSAEANFFSEFLIFRQKYYDPEPGNEKFYEDLVAEAQVITGKYENEPFGEFARSLVLTHVGDVDKRSRRMNL